LGNILIKLGLASALLFTTTLHANAEEQKPVAKRISANSWKKK